VAELDALPAWQATAVVLALSFGSAVLLELVGVRLARRLTRRTETALDDISFEELRVPLVVTVALAGIYVLTRVESVATATLVDARTLSLSFGRPSLSVIVLVWARARHDLRAVYHALVDADIETPYPRSDVTVRTAATTDERRPPGDDAVAGGR